MPPAHARPSGQSLMSSQPGLGTSESPTIIPASQLAPLLEAAANQR
jgi:hypothetical protein